jgi:hypothetical protein
MKQILQIPAGIIVLYASSVCGAAQDGFRAAVIDFGGGMP